MKPQATAPRDIVIGVIIGAVVILALWLIGCSAGRPTPPGARPVHAYIPHAYGGRGAGAAIKAGEVDAYPAPVPTEGSGYP